jgi:hypothetical protein
MSRTSVIRLLVGSREYIGAARHAPRSQLYQSLEAAAIVLGGSSMVADTLGYGGLLLRSIDPLNLIDWLQTFRCSLIVFTPRR